MCLLMQTVLDALRARKDRFTFEGNDNALRNSVMAFITMNPGYPGRAELSESLKVQPCSGRCAPVRPHWVNPSRAWAALAEVSWQYVGVHELHSSWMHLDWVVSWLPDAQLKDDRLGLFCWSPSHMLPPLQPT